MFYNSGNMLWKCWYWLKLNNGPTKRHFKHFVCSKIYELTIQTVTKTFR